MEAEPPQGQTGNLTQAIGWFAEEFLGKKDTETFCKLDPDKSKCPERFGRVEFVGKEICCSQGIAVH